MDLENLCLNTGIGAQHLMSTGFLVAGVYNFIKKDYFAVGALVSTGVLLGAWTLYQTRKDRRYRRNILATTIETVEEPKKENQTAEVVK